MKTRIGIECIFDGQTFDRRLVSGYCFKLGEFMKRLEWHWNKHGESFEIRFYDYSKERRKSLDDLCAAIAQESRDTAKIKRQIYS